AVCYSGQRPLQQIRHGDPNELQIVMKDPLQRSLAAIADCLAPTTAQTSNGPP
ncbi:hypothetical protein HAX54_037808, partial [Datura stramonium]|nr:hypothetical protein [Datura stramonium]